MAGGILDGQTLRVVGQASCVGGKHPDPPLDGFPLLCWAVSHPVHGLKVFTEDGAATVEDIAIAAATSANLDAVASQFGTTADHVSQAIDYAVKAGFLGQ